MSISIFFNQIRYIDKALLKWMWRNNIRSGFLSKFLKYDIFLLFIILISVLPFAIKVPLAAVLITPYIRVTLLKSQSALKRKRRLATYFLISLSNNKRDLQERVKLFKQYLYLAFRWFLIFSSIIFILVSGTKFSELSIITQDLPTILNIILVFFISLYFFCPLYIRTSNILGLIILLVLSNPIISLTIIMNLVSIVGSMMEQQSQLFFSGRFDGALYIFVEAGLNEDFIGKSLIYSLILQLIFVGVQPAYKLEKSRIALETVAVIFGAISILGLTYSNEASKLLFVYLTNTKSFGNEFFHYASISDIGEFKVFYERCLKMILLPYSFCSSMAILIFKYRESNSKNKMNSIISEVSSNNILTSDKKVMLLRKALYYGGGNARNIILGHYLFSKLVFYLSKKKSVESGWFNIKIKQISQLFKYFKLKMKIEKYNIQSDLKSWWLNLHLEIFTKISYKQGIFRFLIVSVFMICAIGTYITFNLGGKAGIFLTELSSYYVEICGNDKRFAIYLISVLYLFVVCCYLLKRSISLYRINYLIKKEILTLIFNFLLFLSSILIIIFNLFKQDWILILILPGLYHLIWFFELIEKKEFILNETTEDI